MKRNQIETEVFAFAAYLGCECKRVNSKKWRWGWYVVRGSEMAIVSLRGSGHFRDAISIDASGAGMSAQLADDLACEAATGWRAVLVAIPDGFAVYADGKWRAGWKND